MNFQPVRFGKRLVQTVLQKPRHFAVAGAMLFGGPAATAWGASSAGASPTNDNGTTPSSLVVDTESTPSTVVEESTPTTATPTTAAPTPTEPTVVEEEVVVEEAEPAQPVAGHPEPEPECGTGVEMDPCPTPTTAAPTTTAPTTTAPPSEEVCDDDLNVAFRAAFDEEFEKIARYRGYESYDDIPADVIAQIDWEAFWNTALAMKNQFGFENQEELLHALELCDICPPPEAPTPPTTAPPTTAPPTTAPPTTAPPTTAAPTTAPPTTAAPTTAPPTTAAPTTAPPATYPLGPTPTLPGAPTELAETGSGVLGLVPAGGGLVVAGASALGLSVAARRKQLRNQSANGSDIVAGGEPPVRDDSARAVVETSPAKEANPQFDEIVARLETSAPKTPKSERFLPYNLRANGGEIVRTRTGQAVILGESAETKVESGSLILPEGYSKPAPVVPVVPTRDPSMTTPAHAITPTKYEVGSKFMLPAALRGPELGR